jgi:tetraacyldisaccharide 4'-kinase
MHAPEFWNGSDIRARLTRAALAPVGWAYGATVAYKAANAKPFRSPAKVICVGNLTVGGTGKTPIVIAIARTLMERQQKVRILTRGYGGRIRGPAVVHPQVDLASDTGDEALVLAAAAPVIVSRDRADGAKLAQRKGVDVIVMDDGHQNFSLAKDLSLLVIDAEQGFGNGRLLPAGPLREPVAQGLARADAAVVVGEAEFDLPSFAKPVLRARLVPVDVLGLQARRVIAFAGIGRPEKFFATLHKLGADIAQAHAFPDHHVYSAPELARLRNASHTANALLVTTEKDFVRLPPAQRLDIRYLPVRAAFEDLRALAALLDTVAPRALDAAVA